MNITIVRGDITKQTDVDAIVNAAHPSLEGGGGVDGAIHRAAGKRLLEECLTFPEVPPDEVDSITQHILMRAKLPWRTSKARCKVGDAVITGAYALSPVKYVIHTVGPLYDPSQPVLMANSLAIAFARSLMLAEEKGCKRVAFPAISCGVFRFPLDEAAKVAMMVARRPEWKLDELRFVLFEEPVYQAFSEALNSKEDAS